MARRSQAGEDISGKRKRRFQGPKTGLDQWGGKKPFLTVTTGKEGTFPLLLTAQPSKPHTAVNVQDTASKDLLNGRGAWRVYSRSTIISLVFKKNHNACCVENRLKGTGRLIGAAAGTEAVRVDWTRVVVVERKKPDGWWLGLGRTRGTVLSFCLNFPEDGGTSDRCGQHSVQVGS